MWRPFFMAIGVTLLVLGLECTVLEKAVLAEQFAKKVPAPEPDPYSFEIQSTSPTLVKREIVPPEWAPWSLFSAGSVVLLYAIAMRPKKPAEG